MSMGVEAGPRMTPECAVVRLSAQIRLAVYFRLPVSGPEVKLELCCRKQGYESRSAPVQPQAFRKALITVLHIHQIMSVPDGSNLVLAKLWYHDEMAIYKANTACDT